MPTPTPVSAPGSQQFTELQHIADQLVAALQALGVGLLAISIALIGLAVWTSFGNEHRHATTRAAAVGLLTGVAILAYAHPLADLIRRIFPL